MAKGDVTILRERSFSAPGSQKYQVAAGTTASINPGELVLKALGASAVTVWTASNSAKPVVATDFVAGLSASTSTETASLAGSVEVIPVVRGLVYLIAPNDTTAFDTQAEYNALVGDRVLLNTTAGGVQTILASDSATSGLVIEDLDIATYPGRVAFSIREGASYLA